MTLLAWQRYGPEPADGEVPLVLLHAFPLDSQMWTYVVTGMPQVPVITIDAPGFGASAAIEGGLAEYADAVAATLARADVDRAVVAGLSMGGYTALALAQRHPGIFAGVGLLDTKAGADPEEVRGNRLQMAENALGPAGADVVAPMAGTLLGQEPDPQVRDELRHWLTRPTPEAIAWAQQAMAARPDRWAALAGLQERGVAPLVLRGSQDAMASTADHQEIATALGTRVVEIDGAGHLSALEQPRAVAAALEELWRRATPESSESNHS